jgi:hypothetical protein
LVKAKRGPKFWPPAVARDLWEKLRALGWKYWQPSPDDATSQTAKLSKTVEGQGIKQVDFLDVIIGLKTD